MEYGLIISSQARREHELRLLEASSARLAVQVCRRMRIRNDLRKAILETVKLDGSTEGLAVEFSGLVRRAEGCLSERSCC